MNLAERIRGSFTVLRLLPGQWRMPFLPTEQVAEVRDARVREIVRYAAETVPYYRDLFAREGIDPREIRSAQQLRQLPLIDKKVVLEDPDRFRSTSAEGRDAVSFTTTGSSWVPLTVHLDRRALLANIAHSERYRMVERAVVGKKFRYVVASIAHDGAGRLVDDHYRTTTMRHLASTQHRIPLGEPVERILERIAELRPDVLSGVGSYIEELFRLVADRGLSMHLPRVVRYGGDLMSTEGRTLIEKHFGLPVLSNYNAVEAFKIGHFCELRRGYHLYEDLCDLWIAGPASEPCAAGELGEVVISNLVNRATVLLNYRLGDLARRSEEPCPCGRTSRVLSSLEGRVSQIVHLPNGDIVHPFVILQMVRGHEEVTRWQLVQREPASFELKLMTVDRAAYERIADTIVAQARDILHGARVDVAYHDSLELGPGGKFRPVVPMPQ